KKAKPMIVVMPNGHISPFRFVPPPKDGAATPKLRFEDEFSKDILPYIEKNYRVTADTANRAIAGLSMGGGQTLNISFAKPRDFGYVGVFSSGVIFNKAADWENDHKDALSDATAKEGLKMLWFATGSQDFLLDRTKETVEMFKKHGFKPTFKE